MFRSRVRSGLILWVVAMVVAAPFAMARDDDRRDGRGRGRDDHRHEDVRGAVERGEIKPLVDVLQIVQPKLPGEIVGVEAENKTGVWLYEFRVLDKQGRLFEVYVDATTAEITKIKEK
jgi:uncharacterized membrane protein YkoI